MTIKFRTKTWFLAGLLPLLACSHDSKRDNPLDPALTPPVDLQVAIDDTAGTVTLTWTSYSGEQPFAAYWILRRVQQLVEIDTLALIDAPSQTSFVDTLSPNTAYQYRVSVVNASGFEATTAESGVPGYAITPVQLLDVEIDRLGGSALLSWTRFSGARFESLSGRAPCCGRGRVHRGRPRRSLN